MVQWRRTTSASSQVRCKMHVIYYKAVLTYSVNTLRDFLARSIEQFSNSSLGRSIMRHFQTHGALPRVITKIDIVEKVHFCALTVGC